MRARGGTGRATCLVLLVFGAACGGEGPLGGANIEQGHAGLVPLGQTLLDPLVGGTGIAQPAPTPLLREYPLLVLTPDQLRIPAYLLAAHKQTTGMPTLVKTVESITADPSYASGRDVQEKIKLAINRLHLLHGVKYVLLLGDVDMFPVRWVWINDHAMYGRRYQPSDLYYADLRDPVDDHAINDLDNGAFNDWDANGDSRFGEAYAPEAFSSSWSQLNADQLDLVPEVAVGRIPASNATEASTAVSKIVDYEQLATRPWNKRAMVVTGNWDNPNPLGEAISALLQDDGYSVTEHLWDASDATWDDPIKEGQRRATLRAEFAHGYGLVSYLGHGTPTSWAGWYQDTDVAMVNNRPMMPIVFAAACGTALFHTEERRYRDVSGQLYTCDANRFEGDATFVMLPFTPRPEWVRLQTVNLTPQQFVVPNAAGDGVDIAEGFGSWFVKTAPQKDPRPYWRSLRAYNYPDHYVRHQYQSGKLTPISSDLDRQDGSFRPVPGLANPDSGQELVSFESWNYPGWYLVDEDGQVVLRRRRICDDAYDAQATFKAVGGLADGSAVSFESYQHAGRYLRHRNYSMHVESGSGDLFQQDATFWLVDSQHDPRPDYASFVSFGTTKAVIHQSDDQQLQLRTPANETDRTRATFRVMPGVDPHAEGATVSLEALVTSGGSHTTRTQPARFVRHMWGRLRIAERRSLLHLDQPEPAAVQSPVGGVVVDVDSLAEEMIVKHRHGAIAYVGAYTGAQRGAKTLNVIFFEELAARRGAVLGDVWNAALTRYVEEELDFTWGGWGPGATYDHLHKMMLYGDPSLRVGGLN